MFLSYSLQKSILTSTAYSTKTHYSKPFRDPIFSAASVVQMFAQPPQQKIRKQWPLVVKCSNQLEKSLAGHDATRNLWLSQSMCDLDLDKPERWGSADWTDVLLTNKRLDEPEQCVPKRASTSGRSVSEIPPRGVLLVVSCQSSNQQWVPRKTRDLVQASTELPMDSIRTSNSSLFCLYLGCYGNVPYCYCFLFSDQNQKWNRVT